MLEVAVLGVSVNLWLRLRFLLIRVMIPGLIPLRRRHGPGRRGQPFLHPFFSLLPFSGSWRRGTDDEPRSRGATGVAQ